LSAFSVGAMKDIHVGVNGDASDAPRKTTLRSLLCRLFLFKPLFH
jgi:hypothetical protein